MDYAFGQLSPLPGLTRDIEHTLTGEVPRNEEQKALLFHVSFDIY